MKVTDMKPTKTAIYLSTILFAAALPSFAAEISNWKGGASGIWGVGYESNWDTYPDSTRYAKFGSPSSEPITVTVDETVEAYGVVISSGRTADLFFTGNGMLKNYRSQLIQTSSSIVTDWNINVTNINGNSALNIYGTNVFHKVLDCSDVYTFSVKDNAKVTLCDSAQLIGQHMTLAAGSSFECLDSSVSELTKDLKCSPGSSLKVADNSVLAVRGMWLPFTQQEGVDEEWTMEGGEIRSVGTNGLVLPYTNATKTVSGTGTLYAYKFSVDNASNLVIRLIGPKAYLGHTWFDGGDTRNIIFEVGGGSTLGAYGQDLYFQYWTNKVVGTVTVDTIDYADKSTPRTIAMSKFFDCNGTITVNGTGTFMINETITQPNLGLTVKDSATLGQVSWGSAYALGDIVLEDSARFDVPKYLGHKTTPNCVKSITMRDDTTLTVPRYVQASGDVVLSGNASAVICNSSNDSGAALSCANLSLADNASLSVTGTIAATSLTMSGNSHLAFTAGTAIEAGAAFGAGNWTMEITIPSGYEAGIRPVVIGAGFEGDFADHVTLVGDTEGWSARTHNGNLIIYKGPLPPMLIVECETATVQAPVCEAGGMFRSAAQVSVRLSQAYDHPLVVTITPGFENGASANWGDYVRFSTTTSEVSVLPPADPPTVIIPANSTDKQTLFLYALRSDYNTIGPGSQIILTPSFDDSAAADVITEFSIAGLWISAAKPIITSPGPGSVFDTAINAEIDLEVSVEDTYADMHDTTTGYTVRIKKTAVEGLTTLPERYRVDEYGNLVGLSSGSYPKLTFDAPGNHCPQIMVISPVSGESSYFVSFNVCVEDPAVHVEDPVVQISTPEWLNETDTNQYVQIGVAYWEDSVLTARVEVVEGREGKANPGVLKLDSAYASQLPGEDNVYYVELRDGSAAIAIESMDGTNDSSIYGFTIRASIVSSDINYIPAQERVCIYNVAPVCDVTPENSTAWNVVIGGTPTNSIHWQVSRDAAGDFAGTTSFPGIKVSFWGDCLNAQTFYVTEPSSGVFTPDLGSGMGYQVVYLTIEDKDGAGQYWTYQYEVGYPMETVDGISWCYWINDGKASIEYGSKGDLSGDITIPSTIGGCPVTSIGGSAFEGCGDIVSVTIPEGVASIKDDAFRGCSSLVTVKIPDSVTSVGQLAFDGCNNALYDTTTISGVKLVDGWAIGATESLACDLDLTGVRGVGAYAFSNCSGITSLTIPIQYTGGIAANAFDGCINVTNLTAASCPQGLDRRKITHLTIPEGVVGIMPSAFEGCSALTNVSIPNSVIWINNSVFRGCSALANVSIPESVTTVGAYAFDGCNDALYDTATIPGVKLVDGWAVGTTDDVPCDLDLACVRGIAESAFYGCSGITSVTVPQCVCSLEVSRVFQSSYQSITNIVILDGVTDLGDDAFSYCSSVKNLIIPESVKSIGAWAFSGCNGLTSIVLPNALTNIGRSAFSSCSSLTDVTIPGSVRRVVEHAFDNCRGLTNVTISAGVESIEECAFYGCAGLTSLTLPDSVTNVAYYAFGECSGLASVTIPQSVCSSSRNSGAFLLESVTNVVISDRATNIGKSTFSHWENLVSVTIGSSVTNIGQSAFYNCRNLTSVTIGNSVVNIEKGAFRDCEALPDINIPSSVTNIGRYGFWYCTSLTNIVFYGNAPTCDDYVFEDIASGCVAFVSPKSTGWGVAAGEEWYGLTLQYWPEVLTAVGSAAEAQSILSEFADARIAAGISTVGEYNQFTAWANDKNLYQPDLKDSAHAWASYVLGAEALLANEPKIDFEAVEVGATESGSLWSASPTMTVSVSVRDGERAVAVDANSVAGMFEATSDLGDWAGAALSVDVEVVDDGGTSPSHQMRFKATPGDSPSQAFLRIRK